MNGTWYKSENRLLFSCLNFSQMKTVFLIRGRNLKKNIYYNFKMFLLHVAAFVYFFISI